MPRTFSVLDDVTLPFFSIFGAGEENKPVVISKRSFWLFVSQCSAVLKWVWQTKNLMVIWTLNKAELKFF